MHCVDLGESFPTNICLQKLASIHTSPVYQPASQPRTSPLKFAMTASMKAPAASRAGRGPRRSGTCSPVALTNRLKRNFVLTFSCKTPLPGRIDGSDGPRAKQKSHYAIRGRRRNHLRTRREGAGEARRSRKSQLCPVPPHISDGRTGVHTAPFLPPWMYRKR